LRRLAQTCHEVQRYRDLAWAMVVFWIYANGIGTIIVMAAAYGAELGLSDATLIGTSLMVQFLAAPFAMLFPVLSRRIGTINGILVALSVYVVIAIFAFFLYYEWQFWASSSRPSRAEAKRCRGR